MSERINRVALISGASRSIGRQCALTLAKNGFDIVINYNNSESRAESLKAEIESIGVRALCVKADVSDSSQVKEMVKKTIDAFGKIDVLVNNAGIAQQKLFTDITDEDFRRMFAVNVDGVFYLCREVLPYMIHEKSGSIINISSMWGEVGASCEVHYSASKAAVIGLTKALAKEVGLSGIRVNCVSPGFINTDMNSIIDEDTAESIREETPLYRLGQAQDIADAVLFLAQDSSSFITGQIIGVNGGLII